MTIRAFVFDLDGTLLDTLPDLVNAANEAFRQMGFPARSIDEARAFMGQGGRLLIEQLVPANATPDQRQRAFELWRELYIRSGYPLTRPFDGISSTIDELRRRGNKTAILSNKIDESVRTLAKRHFDGLFDGVRGDLPPTPRKPDPTSLLQMLDRLGIAARDAAYVGDSTVDVQVARNADVMAIGVSWGYDAAAPLVPRDLDAYIHHPNGLLHLT